MTELPRGWAAAPLKELIAHDGIFTDGDWVESKDQDPNGSVRLIQLADIADSHFVNKSSRFLTREKANELNCTFLKKGDLLVARMPDPLGRCCVFPFDGEERFVTVVDVCAIRLGSAQIASRYLMRAINSPDVRAKISALQSGSTRKRISRGNLATIPIPIPPLNEQRRIVEKIEAMFERIDKGVENLRAAKATLALYRQSLLKSAFEGRLTADWRAQNADKLEDPKTLLARIQKERDARYKAALDDWQTALTEWRAGGEKGKKPTKPKRLKDIDPQHITLDALPEITHEWGNIRLGELNVTVSDGPFGSNLKTSDYTAAGIQVIRLENIGYGQFLAEKQSFISQEKYETISHHTVYPGTIVVSSFVTDAVRSCLVPDSVPFAINKADCFAVVLDGAQSSRQFLAYYLQSPQVFKQLEGLIHGVGRPRINTTQLKELHYPICSPAEQAEITRILDARLDAADKMEAEIDASLTRADALRQSVLKQAFAGKLVPQDPTDEPATTLLASIKAERAKATKSARKGKITA